MTETTNQPGWTLRNALSERLRHNLSRVVYPAVADCDRTAEEAERLLDRAMEIVEPALIEARRDGFASGRGPKTDPAREDQVAQALHAAMVHNWHGDDGHTALGHGPATDCVQCTESAQVLARVVVNQIAPHDTDDETTTEVEFPTVLPRTHLTLDDARAKVTGWHFAKESLTDHEREILSITEGLLRLIDSRDAKGYAR